jgi:hypothetical protein
MNILALATLWNLTQEHPGTSAARAASAVLLGLYNGSRFPMDLTDLRVLDGKNLSAAISVITCDARCQREVHEWLNHITGRRDFGARFEQLAWDYRRKGRQKKEHLTPFGPAPLILKMSSGDAG